MSFFGTPTRRCWLAVLVITLVGAAVRFHGFGALGLTHFDEGVYAFAGLWAIAPGALAALDPSVVPYAPPGFPILVGLSYSVFGVSDSPAIFVAIVCGTLTIPVAAWVAGRTFGRAAAVSAAVFAAASLAHIAFSRKALTDAPFLLVWVASLAFGVRFLERPTPLRAIVMGLMVGLAQNTKYNGWMSGAVTLLAAFAGIAFCAEQRRTATLARTLGYGLLGAVVAGVFYGPWVSFVEAHGGYSDLLRHHRSYLGGPGTWYPFLSQQLSQSIALSGGAAWRLATWGVAWVSAIVVAGPLGPGPSGRRSWSVGVFGLLCGGVVFGFWPTVAWWLGLAWSPWLLADARASRRALGAWWLLFSVMTPFYHPYARLWLPIEAAGWLMSAGAIGAAIDAGTQFSGGSLRGVVRGFLAQPTFRPRIAGGILCVAVGVVQFAQTRAQPFPLEWFFEPTNHVRLDAVDTGTWLLADARRHPELLGVGQPRVFASRAFAFYFMLVPDATARPEIEPTLDELLRNGRLHDRGFVDGAMLPADITPEMVERRLSAARTDGLRWYWRRDTERALDPVTLLDVNPGIVQDADASRRYVATWYGGLEPAQ
jgi:4-amino-4-deoxy-L-arabinose transferase-like glycosyltransferase